MGRRGSTRERYRSRAYDPEAAIAVPTGSSPTTHPLSRLLRSRARNVRLVIRYQGSATIQQGKTVIEGECVVESGGDQLAEPALPWSGRFHDPAPAASLEEGRAWLRLNEPVREGAIKITRAGSGSGAGLIDFDGIGSLRELR
jgi:hypothetical protein